MRQLTALLVGGVTLLAVQGCSEEAALYLGGPAGPAAAMQLSTSRIDLAVGTTAELGASAVDAVGNPTGAAVSFSSCDGSVVSVGAAATAEPEFDAAVSVSATGLGQSCINVSAAGLSAEVVVNTGPAGLKIVGDPIVGYDSQDPPSNGPFDFTLEAVDASGNPLTGTTAYQWSASDKSKIEVDPTTGTIVRTKNLGTSVLRVVAPGGANDALGITVAAPVFTGTSSANSGSQGDLVTLTRAGGGAAFDATVTAGFGFGAKSAFVDSWTADNLTVAVPILGVTGRSDLVIRSYGPLDVDRRVIFNSTTASLLDQYSPGNIDNACGVPGTIPSFNAEASPGGWVYLAHTGSSQGTRGCLNGGTGYDHWITYTTGGAPETRDVLAYWKLTGDNDILVYDSGFTLICSGFSGATLAEEACAGLTLLANSTYYIIYVPWTGNTGTNDIRITVR